MQEVDSKGGVLTNAKSMLLTTKLYCLSRSKTPLHTLIQFIYQESLYKIDNINSI